MIDDNISKLKQRLETVEKVIAEYEATGGQRTTSIGGASFSYASLKELTDRRDDLVREIEAAETATKNRKSYKITMILPV